MHVGGLVEAVAALSAVAEELVVLHLANPMLHRGTYLRAPVAASRRPMLRPGSRRRAVPARLGARRLANLRPASRLHAVGWEQNSRSDSEAPLKTDRS